MKIFPLIAALGAFGVLTSCNTVRGAGQDVEATGNAVAGAATEVQSDMQREEAERVAKEEREARERAAAAARQ